MDDVGVEVERRNHLHDRATEVNRPRIVVAEPEHAVAVVERRAVDEVDRQLPEARLEDRRRQDLGAERHLEVRDDRAQSVAGDVHLAVARQHDPDVVAQTPQLLRERGRDVRHSAELRERRQLGRRDQHLQVLRLGDLDGMRLPRNADTERARWRHDLDVPPLAADDDRELEPIARALRQLTKWNRDEKWILDRPRDVDGTASVWLERARDADRAALCSRGDSNDVGRLETELAQRGARQRKVDVSVAVRDLWTRDIKPELRVLLLELVRRARRIDP